MELKSAAHSQLFIADITRRLVAGEVLVVPTDTVYGFVADATSAEAVRRIFKIKGRSRKPFDAAQGKPLPIFMSDIAMARRYARIPKYALPALRQFWPGALTAVLPLRINHKRKGLRRAQTVRSLAPAVLRGHQSVAMRIPNVPWLLKVIKKFGQPVTGTSANISSKPPAQSGKAAWRTFSALPRSRQPDFILDGGYARGMPSTIVDFTVYPPRVLRAGKNVRRARTLLRRPQLFSYSLS